MQNNIKALALGFGLLLTGSALRSAAQTETATEKIKVMTGAYERTHFSENLPVPVAKIREADALYSWKVWRVIDMQQKQNLPFAHPSYSFINQLMKVVSDPAIADYVFSDDSLIKPLTSAEVKSKFAGSVDTQDVMNIETGESERKIVPQIFDPNSIKKFRIMEEWVFDKQTSTMQVRIIALAPIKDQELSDGTKTGNVETLFWVYFPAIRAKLAQSEVFNWQNDAAKLSYDDVFQKRLFASYIYKESNVRDMKIQDYATGKETLRESDRIKYRITDVEQAMWEY